MMKPDSPLTADVDRQLTLLRLAARVDPNLRQAVADVEDAIATLRTQLEQTQGNFQRETLRTSELSIKLQHRHILLEALRNQGLLQKTATGGFVWHVHDCPASFDFAECNYRCRVAREAFALAGTEPYVSQETRRDTEVYE